MSQLRPQTAQTPLDRSTYVPPSLKDRLVQRYIWIPLLPTILKNAPNDQPGIEKCIFVAGNKGMDLDEDWTYLKLKFGCFYF